MNCCDFKYFFNNMFFFFTIVFPSHILYPKLFQSMTKFLILIWKENPTITLQTRKVQHLAWKERQWGKTHRIFWQEKGIASTPFCLKSPDLGQAHISDFASRKLLLSTSTTLLLYVKPGLMHSFPTGIHCIREFSINTNLQNPAFISEIHL